MHLAKICKITCIFCRSIFAGQGPLSSLGLRLQLFTNMKVGILHHFLLQECSTAKKIAKWNFFYGVNFVLLLHKRSPRNGKWNHYIQKMKRKFSWKKINNTIFQKFVRNYTWVHRMCRQRMQVKIIYTLWRILLWKCDYYNANRQYRHPATNKNARITLFFQM